MKIAFVADCFVPTLGQGRVNLETLKRCLIKGWDVTLMASKVDPIVLEWGARVIPTNPIVQRPQLVRGWSFARKANRQVGEHGSEYDLIIGNGSSITVPHDVNVSHFVHAAWKESPANPSTTARGAKAWYQRVYTSYNAATEQLAYSRARHVIAVSENVRKDLIKIGISSEKLHVIYNGVDLEEFKPALQDRSKYGLPGDVSLGLFAGDIKTPRKNLDTVLKALAHVDGLHLVVVGETQGSPYLRLAESLGLSGRVHFLGFRRDIKEIMRCSDFFVFPTRYDPCPLVALEAIASGLPIITSSSTGAADIATEETGFMIEANDVQACALHMRSLANDRSLREKLSRGARAMAERHSWDRMGEEYVRLFQRLARNQNGMPSVS